MSSNELTEEDMDDLKHLLPILMAHTEEDEPQRVKFIEAMNVVIDEMML